MPAACIRTEAARASALEGERAERAKKSFESTRPAGLGATSTDGLPRNLDLAP